MTDPKYKAFTALDPDNAVFEFRYIFPGWPRKIDSREALMALYVGYGNNILLHGADALVVHRSRDACTLILEYEVHGKTIRTGAAYDNRFISVVTIEDRKIVKWRDYMDSLTAMTALSQTQ
jgi:ketosteroid isomerase-like protein